MEEIDLLNAVDLPCAAQLFLLNILMSDIHLKLNWLIMCLGLVLRKCIISAGIYFKCMS